MNKKHIAVSLLSPLKLTCNGFTINPLNIVVASRPSWGIASLRERVENKSYLTSLA
jgi:hypothetical protein